MDAGLTDAEHLEYDGVDYDLAVMQHGEAYYALWACAACNEQTACREASLTPQEAKNFAKAELAYHHSHFHAIHQLA